MRLFVAVQPPEDVLDQVSELVTALREGGDADSVSGMRWTGRAQWHITLRFLGEVDDPDEVTDALGGAGLASPGPVEAMIGPKVDLLGQSVVCVPVAGLDGLASKVVAATEDVGEPPDPRPFHGHLTLARLPRRGRVDTSPWVGYPFFAAWPVNEVHVVQSHRQHDGSRYEVLATMPML